MIYSKIQNDLINSISTVKLLQYQRRGEERRKKIVGNAAIIITSSQALFFQYFRRGLYLQNIKKRSYIFQFFLQVSNPSSPVKKCEILRSVLQLLFFRSLCCPSHEPHVPCVSCRAGAGRLYMRHRSERPCGYDTIWIITQRESLTPRMTQMQSV